MSNVIGSLGVAMLLVAFALNVSGRTRVDSTLNLALNVLGAALACSASVMIKFAPFVVLEGLWSAVAALSWFKAYHRRSVEIPEAALHRDR